jgi:[ribosomal protein S5]-alanine N-acetyltransferase
MEVAHRILTPRLDLHPMERTDADALHRLWTRPEVRRWLWDDRVIPPEQTLEVVETSAHLFDREGFGLWAVTPRGGGELLGFGGFWHFREPPELELLFGIAAPHWGRGYATEVAGALTRHAFDHLGFPEVRASTDAPNTASVRVLAKLGFRQQKRATVGGLDTLFFVLPRER